MFQVELLAAEAGGGTVPIVILVVALAAFAVAYFVVGPGKRRGPKRYGDIPLAMRPYHSDEELETKGMERAMAWGVALAVFSGLFLPLYWLIEPVRINDRLGDFYEKDVALGRVTYQNACAQCHGVNLEGGSAPHPNPEITAPWPAPALNNIVARYEDVDIIRDVHAFIVETTRQGRPGTPMPAWGTEFGGAMNDQQIEAITAYILSVQTGEVPEAQAFAGRSGEDIFAANCATCHGFNAEGMIGPQLVNVFDRFGWREGDEQSLQQARAFVRDAIVNGRYVPTVGLMPPFAKKLDEESITALIDYLESIQRPGGPRYGYVGMTVEDDQ